MPSRPKVSVSLRPGVITPGSTFEAIVRLEGKKPTDVASIEARFWGESQCFWGEATSRAHRSVELVATDSAKRLPAGPYEMRVRFNVPTNAPPSYRGTTLRTEFTLRVHVNIPWWPDRVAEFTIPVVTAPIAAPIATPSAQLYDPPNDVRAEVAIDRSTLAPGSVLTGRIAFSRTRESALGVVKLRLRCIETTQFGVYDGANYVLELPITRHVDGLAHTFRMKIPESATPAIQSMSGSTRWQLDLDVSTRGVERTLLSFPLAIVGVGSEGIDTPTELPLIGDQRRAEMYARIARQCAMHFDSNAQRLLGDVNGLSLDVGQSDHGTTELRLRWPRLGLRLHVGASRWNDALSPHEILVGHKAFDDRYQVRAREAAQVKALLSLQPEALTYLAEAQALKMDDDGLLVQISDISHREEAMTRFVLIAQSIANALRERMKLVPPCAFIADKIEAWRSLAARYSGVFNAGDGALDRVELGAERIHLAHEFNDDGARATTLTAKLDPPMANAPSPDISASVRAEWRASLDALSAGGARWSCTADALSVRVEPAVHDPVEAERWIERLALASRTIQGRRDTGPFR